MKIIIYFIKVVIIIKKVDKKKLNKEIIEDLRLLL
jgi:hypothetical protein